MTAPKGNQFWKKRSKHGRDRIFATPQDMWDAAVEYFEHVEANPLKKAIVYQGVVSDQSENLMRAMTLDGLCYFLKVNSEYFGQFEKSLDLDTEEGRAFSWVIKDIRTVIKDQKIQGAAAGLLKENIIARETGLADKTDNTHTGANGGAIEHVTAVQFVGVSPKN